MSAPGPWHEWERVSAPIENHSDLAPLPWLLSRQFTEPVGVDNGPPTGRAAEPCGALWERPAVAANFSHMGVIPDISVALQVLAVEVIHRDPAVAGGYIVRLNTLAQQATLLAAATFNSNLFRYNSLPQVTAARTASIAFGGAAAAQSGNAISEEQFAVGQIGRRVFDFRPHGIILYGAQDAAMRNAMTLWRDVVNLPVVGTFYCREWRLR